MRLPVHEDQFTEVTISGDQNPTFPVRDGEDFVIWHARGVLIEQESHASAVAEVALSVAAANASFRCRERR